MIDVRRIIIQGHAGKEGWSAAQEIIDPERNKNGVLDEGIPQRKKSKSSHAQHC